jgi:hypothetical protein
MTIATGIKTMGLIILFSEKDKPFLLMLKNNLIKNYSAKVDVVQKIKYLYLPLLFHRAF